MSSLFHPSAEILSSTIGKNTRIWQYVVVLPKAKIGENCNINAHCFIENDVVIGNNVTVKSGVYLWDGARIEDNVFIGQNVSFVNDLQPRSKIHPNNYLTTRVRHGASLGANSTILGGIDIGEYAMIGAGSVVTKNIPNNCLWFGNPAAFKAYICDCGNKLNEKHACPKCGKEYIIKNDCLLPVQYTANLKS